MESHRHPQEQQLTAQTTRLYCYLSVRGVNVFISFVHFLFNKALHLLTLLCPLSTGYQALTTFHRHLIVTEMWSEVARCLSSTERRQRHSSPDPKHKYLQPPAAHTKAAPHAYRRYGTTGIGCTLASGRESYSHIDTHASVR